MADAFERAIAASDRIIESCEKLFVELSKMRSMVAATTEELDEDPEHEEEREAAGRNVVERGDGVERDALGGEEDRDEDEARGLGCDGCELERDAADVPSVISRLELSNPTKRFPIFIYALHLVELTGRASNMLAAHHSASNQSRSANSLPGASEHTFDAFENYEAHASGVTIQALTAVSPYQTMHEDVCILAEDKHVSLIVLPFHSRLVSPLVVELAGVYSVVQVEVQRFCAHEVFDERSLRRSILLSVGTRSFNTATSTRDSRQWLNHNPVATPSPSRKMETYTDNKRCNEIRDNAAARGLQSLLHKLGSNPALLENSNALLDMAAADALHYLPPVPPRPPDPSLSTGKVGDEQENGMSLLQATSMVLERHPHQKLQGLEKNHKGDASAFGALEEPSPKEAKTHQSSPAEGKAEKASISVEYAKSGRSTCKGCGENIAKGTLRLGASVRDPRGFDSTKWYHITCFPASSYPVFPVKNVKGFDSIENSDCDELRKLEENRKRDGNAADQLKEPDLKKQIVHSMGDSKEVTENNLEEVESSAGIKRIGPLIPFSASDIKKTYKDAALPTHWKVFDTVIFREQEDGLHASAKIAAFDFDGCLAKTSVRSVGADKWSLQHKSIPERLQRLYNDGYKLVIFTNESNIERWKNKRQQAVDSKVGRLDNFIECVKVPIQDFIACGLGEGKGTPDDLFRRPNPGMWWLMTEHFNSGIAIDMDQSFYVGKSPTMLTNGCWPYNQTDLLSGEILSKDKLSPSLLELQQLQNNGNLQRNLIPLGILQSNSTPGTFHLWLDTPGLPKLPHELSSSIDSSVNLEAFGFRGTQNATMLSKTSHPNGSLSIFDNATFASLHDSKEFMDGGSASFSTIQQAQLSTGGLCCIVSSAWGQAVFQREGNVTDADPLWAGNGLWMWGPFG